MNQLEAVQRDGTVYVSVKRACECLGLSAQRQQRKLEEAAWAVTAPMAATGPDGKSYEMLCLPLDQIPMWLATIHVNRVAEGLREKLALYQCECRAAA